MSNRQIVRAVGIGIALVVGLVLVSGSLTGGTSSPAVVQDITPADYQAQFSADMSSHLLIDVRTPEEFATGHIAGAVNIPVDDLAGRLAEVPMNQQIVVYCRSGNRSAQAAQILAEAGYSGISDLGGLNAWTAQGLPLE